MLRGQSCRPFSVAGTEGHQQFVILPIPYSLGRSEPRAHGKKLFMNTEPKPGAAASRGRSVPSPSERSIMEVATPEAARMPPSLTRGMKERWWPVGKLPPSVPVTAIRSPARAVLRSTALPSSTSPVSATLMISPSAGRPELSPPGDADAELPRQPPHAAVNSFHLGDGAVCVHEQGHQCVKGRAAHGPYV